MDIYRQISNAQKRSRFMVCSIYFRKCEEKSTLKMLIKFEKFINYQNFNIPILWLSFLYFINKRNDSEFPFR